MPENKQHPWTKPREHSRYLLDQRLVVRAKETLHGRTKDIAEGGLGATIPGNINVGDIVELELQLPNDPEPLKLKAVAIPHLDKPAKRSHPPHHARPAPGSIAAQPFLY